MKKIETSSNKKKCNQISENLERGFHPLCCPFIPDHPSHFLSFTNHGSNLELNKKYNFYWNSSPNKHRLMSAPFSDLQKIKHKDDLIPTQKIRRNSYVSKEKSDSKMLTFGDEQTNKAFWPNPNPTISQTKTLIIISYQCHPNLPWIWWNKNALFERWICKCILAPGKKKDSDALESRR